MHNREIYLSRRDGDGGGGDRAFDHPAAVLNGFQRDEIIASDSDVRVIHSLAAIRPDPCRVHQLR